MHIPVKIEIGCNVLVVMPLKKHSTYVNTVEKWCEVTEIFNSAIKVDNIRKKIPLYALKYFTFGSVILPNPDFDLEQLLNDYRKIK